MSEIDQEIKDVQSEIKGVKEELNKIKADSDLKINDSNHWKNCLEQLQTRLNTLEAKELFFLKQRHSQTDDNNNQFHPLQDQLIRAAQLKLPKIRPYLASMNGECVTVVTSRLFVTHSHGDNKRLKCEDRVTIVFFDNSQVVCRIDKIDNLLDCTWMIPIDEKFTVSAPEHGMPYPGQIVMCLGQSARCQMNKSDSVDISNFSTDDLDQYGHMKISRASAPGDSGCPVFDFYSGKLVGVQTGVENYPNPITGLYTYEYSGRAHVIPIFKIIS